VYGSDLYRLKNSDTKLKMTNVDCERLKRNLGYSIKLYCHESLLSFSARAQAVLEHHFHNHTFCDQRWCKYKECTPELYEEAKCRFRCKVKNSDMYEKLLEIQDKHTDPKMLAQINHQFDSQKNEAINSSISHVAPKNITFCGTCSLQYRIAWVVLCDSVGFEEATIQVFNKIQPNVNLPDAMKTYLKCRDEKKAYNRQYQNKKSVKVARRKRANENIALELAKLKADSEQGVTYRSGMAMDDAATAGVRRTCKHCGLPGHVQARHKACLKNPKNIAAAAAAAAANPEQQFSRQQVEAATTETEKDNSDLAGKF